MLSDSEDLNKEGRKILFIDALISFYLWLYGVGKILTMQKMLIFQTLTDA